MATQARVRAAAATPSSAVGLRLLAVMLGIFFLGMSSSKIAWLTNSDILLQKFQMIFLPKAPPIVRWYLETVCIPGAPVHFRQHQCVQDLLANLLKRSRRRSCRAGGRLGAGGLR